MQARVEAGRKLSWTRCRVAGVAARPVDRRGGAPGRHHHRLASNLNPFSSQRALRELCLFWSGRPTGRRR
eukprot:9065152-Pyramimonas_sp.AAC.1